jgi:hypothetical protein
MWCWRMTEISWAERVGNVEVLQRVKEERNILHTANGRKTDWIWPQCLIMRATDYTFDAGMDRDLNGYQIAPQTNNTQTARFLCNFFFFRFWFIVRDFRYMSSLSMKCRIMGDIRNRKVAKVRFQPVAGHTGPGGSGGIVLLFHDFGTRWGGWWSRPGCLYPRERPGTHCTRSRVGPRAGLDRCGQSRPHRDSIPRPSSP